MKFEVLCPIGELTVVVGDNGFLEYVDFGEARTEEEFKVTPDLGNPIIRQLEEYFGGMRRAFDIPYKLSGTAFQNVVWRQIASIPFGETCTYGEVAAAIGRSGAGRAVGAACGQNPFSIVVPCHRVVGSNHKLTGYGGGLWRKEWLLEYEWGLVSKTQP